MSETKYIQESLETVEGDVEFEEMLKFIASFFHLNADSTQVFIKTMNELMPLAESEPEEKTVSQPTFRQTMALKGIHIDADIPDGKHPFDKKKKATPAKKTPVKKPPPAKNTTPAKTSESDSESTDSDKEVPVKKPPLVQVEADSD